MPWTCLRAAAAAVAAWLGLADGPARADDYDNALECLILVELAKQDYTAENVDALREAGSRMLEWVNASRPPELTDAEKLDRYNAAIDRVQRGGGLSSAENRDLTIRCAAYFDIELVLPAP